MNHYMDFDPGLIRSRNEQMREEVQSLRLEERLRKNRNPRLSRLAALRESAGALLVDRGVEQFRGTEPRLGTTFRPSLLLLSRGVRPGRLRRYQHRCASRPAPPSCAP
jgi:hypothetical protein